MPAKGGRPNSTTFKKGDPRAAAAGRKSKRRPGDTKAVEPTFMDELRARAPEALKALDRGLRNGDPTSLRLVVDRLAPSEVIRDAATAEAMEALRTENANLREELERLIKANAELQAERDAALAFNDQVKASAKAGALAQGGRKHGDRRT